jgi:heme A synthase
MLLKLIQVDYHIIDAVAYFAAAAVPILFVIRSRNSVNNPLRSVAIVLAGFLLAQAAYHTAGILRLTLISKVILEPVSAAILLSAGVVYFLMRKKVLKEEVHKSVGK